MTFEKKVFKSLFAIIFLDQTYLTLSFPLITLIFFDSSSRLFAGDTTYAVRSLWYGLCVGLPNMINIFFAPTLSALSDEIGRKKILIIEIMSAFIFTLTVGLGIYLGILSLVFLGFIVKGAFSRTNPTALAIIGDTASKENKIVWMGYLQLAISIGAAIGPILGGYIANRYFFNELNFSFAFFLAAALALMNTFCAIFLMRETLAKQPNQRWSRFNRLAIKEVITDPDILRISLILLLIQLSWSMYYQYIPPILKTLYQFNSHSLGFFIGMIAVWLIVATGFILKPLDKLLSLRQILFVSLYLVLIGLVLTLLACTDLFPYHSILIWMGAIPTAIGDVIAYSCLTAMYSNVVTQGSQGKVMGVGFIVVAGAWSATGFLGGFLMSISPLLPLIIAPAGVIVSLLLLHQNFGKNLVLSYRFSN